jgi:ethanolamine ammonia-lyase small subunit
MMDDKQVNDIIAAVLKELAASGITGDSNHGGAVFSLTQTANAPVPENKPSFPPSFSTVNIDLPDPTVDDIRYKPQVKNAKNPFALTELVHSTSARIGLGRSGPRYPTSSLLLFQGDHAVTQDALYRDVDQHLLDEFNLFIVQTKVFEGKEEYLLRPDLGRQLCEESKRIISERCVKNPNIQVVVGAGLSSTAIEANLKQIFPIIRQGIETAGLTMGTPFFIQYCRVGVMNDIGDILQPDVLILLIGERPGLGRAESMSAYMGYRPRSGNNDADRDVVCNIFEDGGTNPLEAGAFIVQMAQKMMKYQASGVKLKLATK